MAGTTQITGPGGSNPFSQISSALAPIYSMFGPASGGGGAYALGGGQGNNPNLFGGTGGGTGGNFGLQPQPVSAGNDDLTRYQRSIMDLLGTSGAGLLQSGGNLINTGMGITEGGLGVAGGGLGVQGAGLNMLQQPFNYLSGMASANPQEVVDAAGPFASLVSGQLTDALAKNRQSTPAGGAQAVFQAGAPQAAAAQIGNYELGLQPQAIQALMGLGGEVAGIGQGITAGGLGISGVGGNVMGTGTTLTGQGSQTLQNVAEDILRKMGINIQGGTTATATQWMNAIANLLGSNRATGA